MHIVQAKYLRGLTVVVILMSTLTLVACSTAPASPPSTDRFPPEVETQMAQIVEDQMTQSLIPGVIAGVWIPRATMVSIKPTRIPASTPLPSRATGTGRHRPWSSRSPGRSDPA